MNVRNQWKRSCLLSALCAVSGIAAPAQTFTVLTRFNVTDGGAPLAPVAQGLDGALYGTTTYGGAHLDGTIFRLTTAGAINVLYSTCALTNCADGSDPSSGLVLGPSGQFYGVTQLGGPNSAGTIYKITSGGVRTVLYNFCALTNCPDGAQPVSGLVQGSDGEFYGEAMNGGVYGNYGTVYKVSSGGLFTPLHSFCQDQNTCSDGFDARAVLVQGSDGKYYGTTVGGGNNAGTVFKLAPNTGVLTTIYRFCATSGCPDGNVVTGGVVEGADANYYGTTAFGGTVEPSCTSGCGTVYQITSSGTLATLHQFTYSDGLSPIALTRGSDNNFYGVCENGGLYGNGTIFEITPTGTFTLLHSFSAADGYRPFAGLMQHTNGKFYGTTPFAGSENNVGTVYSLDTGLGPFLKTVPANGRVGNAVRILGTGLTGATSVTFNGTAATFTVVSDTQISTTVPSGATTGKVQVIAPSGTLSTFVAFPVL